MSSAARRESPLYSRREEKIEVAGLSVRELPFRTLLNLRGCPGDADYSLAVSEATGLSLPAANQFNADGGRLLAWLGPDEFLLVGDDRDAGGVEKTLRDRLSGVPSALTDVSAGFTTLVASGAGARDFLAKGWALDLHPRVFSPGHCAQSYLAKAPVLLLCRNWGRTTFDHLSTRRKTWSDPNSAPDAAPVFEAIVRRGIADYLWAWSVSSAKAG
jgi:sarcosine oxidase subunit gamma